MKHEWLTLNINCFEILISNPKGIFHVNRLCFLFLLREKKNVITQITVPVFSS